MAASTFELRYEIDEEKAKKVRLTGVEALKAQLYGPNMSRRGLGKEAAKTDSESAKPAKKPSLDDPESWDTVLGEKKE